MKNNFFIVLAIASGCSSGPSAVPPTVTEAPGAVQVTFPATDKQTVYADFYGSPQKHSKKVVLMFHQAGSNAGEYETIAPPIAELGFDCLAVDQRSGGDMFGRKNRTAATVSGNKDYMNAYEDMKGAVEWAKKKGYAIIVPWGSSYSASLTLKLLGDYPTLQAGLVFSPGEYFDDKSLVKSWAAALKVPVFFACTPDELTDGRQEIFNSLGSAKTSAGPVALPGGVHGSSTCIPAKSPAAGQYMDAVKSFLRKLA